MAPINLNQIFYDNKKKRLRYSRGAVTLIGLFLMVVFSVAMVSIFNAPVLPELKLKNSEIKYKSASGNIEKKFQFLA